MAVRCEARFEARRFFWLFCFFRLLFCSGLEAGLVNGVFSSFVITYAHSTVRGRCPRLAQGQREGSARGDPVCGDARAFFLVSGERAERASPRRSGVLVVLWAGLSPFPGVLVFVRVFPSTSGFL